MDTAQQRRNLRHGCVFTLEVAQLVVASFPSSLTFLLSFPSCPCFSFFPHLSVPDTMPAAEHKRLNETQALPYQWTGGTPQAT